MTPTPQTRRNPHSDASSSPGQGSRLELEGSEPSPLWRQVAEAIRAHVESGRWAPNQRIPSERELSARFGVSRNTVRQAIAQAVSGGWLRRVNGRGTFVAPPRVDQPLAWMQGFEETLRTWRMTPGSRLVAFRVRRVGSPAAPRLLGEKRGELVFVRILGLGDGVPLVVYDSYLPLDLGIPLQEELQHLEQSGQLVLVNRLLGRRHGWEYLQAHQVYEACGAPADVAALLQVATGAPLLRVSTLFSNPLGRPVEYREALYRADRYRFHITRRLALSDGPAASAGEKEQQAWPGPSSA